MLFRIKFFFSRRRRHTRYWRDWSSDVCSSDLRRDETARAGGPFELGLVHTGLEQPLAAAFLVAARARSEERRVGKECRARMAAYHEKKKGERRIKNDKCSIGTIKCIH